MVVILGVYGGLVNYQNIFEKMNYIISKSELSEDIKKDFIQI
jgi:hypothetical protein